MGKMVQKRDNEVENTWEAEGKQNRSLPQAPCYDCH